MTKWEKTKDNLLWSEVELGGEIEYRKERKLIEANNTWHNLFEIPQWILLNPAEEVVQFYMKYFDSPSRQIKERISLEGKKLHDLGCGGGRHLFYFAELGFEVTGSDLSTNAINATESELKRRGLNADLKVCEMTALPFDDNTFDVTISRAAINHGTIQDMKKAIYEVARTTKSGGLFFLTVSSDRASDYNNGEEIESEMSYAPVKGPEKGLVHTFFNVSRLAALLEPFFRIEEMNLSEHPPLMPNAPGATDSNEYFGSEYVVVGVKR